MIKNIMQIRNWVKITSVIFFIGFSLPQYLLSQDAIYSQFYANPLYLNPAMAGTQICPQLNINYRNNPNPDYGYLSNYSVSYHRHWKPVSGGVGLLITSEHLAHMLRRQFFGGIYSYHSQLTRNMHLSFGVNAAYYRKDLQSDNLIFPDQYDRSTGNIYETSETLPDNSTVDAFDVSSGILIYSESFFVGIAGHHLTQPKETYFLQDRMPLKFTLHSGMQFSISRYRRDIRNIQFSPNIILQHQDRFLRINYGIYFDIEPLAMGAWFRQDFKDQKTLIFLFGLYRENYRIGYSYDYSLSGIYGGLSGVHEISISLNFNCDRQKLEYKILNCPNF